MTSPVRTLVTFAIITMCLPAHSYSSITGTVTDSLGDPIPRALVMFTSEPDSVYTYRAVTDSMGYYEITELPVGVAEEEPAPFVLGQNYPNPFNPATTIPLTLDAPGHVSLTVYNSMGQRIRTLVDDYLSNGTHSVIWDARDESGQHVGSGVYLYAVRYNGYTEAKKMLLLDSGGMSGAVSAPVIAQTSARKVSSDPIYSISVERFPYTAIHQTYVSITTHTYDFTLEDADLMVSIPGGTFQMGDEVGDLEIFCRPEHTVTVSGYDMHKYEITNEQYCAYLNAALASGDIEVRMPHVNFSVDVYGITGDWSDELYIDTDYTSIGDNSCWIYYDLRKFILIPGYESWPVIALTWFGAKAFATYYGFDLPTEAEWEYACRGGVHNLYGTGENTINSGLACFNKDHPFNVGSYQSNQYGLFDMSGNVWEWCHDGFAIYSGEEQINPTGSESNDSRAYRGGVVK